MEIERSLPPRGSNIEDFLNLSVKDAARLLREQTKGGGVPQNAWSNSDQERMYHGQKPLGHPEHPNV